VISRTKERQFEWKKAYGAYSSEKPINFSDTRVCEVLFLLLTIFMQVLKKIMSYNSMKQKKKGEIPEDGLSRIQQHGIYVW